MFGRTYFKFPLILGWFRGSAGVWSSWGIAFAQVCFLRSDCGVIFFLSGKVGVRGVSESIPLFPI